VTRITWSIESRSVASLKPHPRNPRVMTKKQEADLLDSLKRFGLIEKPIVTIDGMIIGGHQRLAILKKLKYKTVECWVPDRELSDEEVDELCIRLNRNTGSWDYESLANDWDLDKLVDWGFSPAEFDVSLTPSDAESGEEEQEEEKCPTCNRKMKKKR